MPPAPPTSPVSGPSPLYPAFHTAGRLLVLDALRGFAMCFVLLSHFATHGKAPSPAGLSPELAGWLFTVSLIASPTFMLVSGMTCAMLLEGSNRSRARRYLFDRALFTLVVGHLYFTVVDIVCLGVWRQSVYMTDTVAVAVLIGLILIPNTTARARAAIGLALFLTAWLIHLGIQPAWEWLRGVEEVIAGPGARPVLQLEFPLLPWTGVFLLGSSLGGTLERARRQGHLAVFARRLFTAGAVGIAVAITLKVVFWVGRAKGWFSPESMWVPILAATTKYPPGPVYLLLFGGAGLFAGGALRIMGERRVTAWLPNAVAVFGRASLFTFLAQALVYAGLVRHAPAPLGELWILWFGGSVVLLGLAAYWWDRLAGNRWLTLGLREPRRSDSVQPSVV